MANPSSRGQQRDKPYRDALRMEQLALANGEVIPHPIGSLRAIAQARLISACAADGQADAREIADRLDGKVPQAIGGSDELPPVGFIVTGVKRPDDDEQA